MLGRSQVRASGQGSDDTLGAHREFARGWLRFERCCWELIENSLEVCREVRREFTDRLSGACRVFAGRMLEVRWEFAEGNRELAGGSSERCREFSEEMIGQQTLYVECRSDDCTVTAQVFGQLTVGEPPIPWNQGAFGGLTDDVGG
ncbi:hypothetical protein B296_00035250 [Ensete ventricosum]|uniref:Uncharacterized protein n=1 Tax=Ensete ventricosum TaxID=4639 RepID=A0A426YSB2_ENSVE|nr:hypothetical protein B296_00035250 [Ensete ventricosum]